MRVDEEDQISSQWQREHPELSEDALQAMALLGRLRRVVAQLVSQQEQALASHGVSLGEFEVLAALRRAGAPYTLTPTQLHTSLMVTSGTMTHRLKWLQERGLVTRSKSPHDSRSVLVILSAKGKKLVDQALWDHSESAHRVFSLLPKAQHAQLDRALRTLLQGLVSERR